MSKVIQQFLSGEITISEDAWHYQFYKWWEQKTGGNSWGYRENLCHYMRVIFIWVPLLWFFTVPLFDRVRAWMITIIVLEFVALWFERGVWLTALMCTGWGVFLYFDKYHKDGMRKFGRRVSPPFVFLWNHGVRKALVFFFTFGRWGVYPWSLTLVTLLVAIGYLLGLNKVLEILKFVGMVALGIIVILAVLVFLYGLYTLVKKLRGESEPKPYYGHHAPQRKSGSSTLQIVSQYVMARKRRICPFITLSDKNRSEAMWPSQN